MAGPYVSLASRGHAVGSRGPAVGHLYLHPEVGNVALSVPLDFQRLVFLDHWISNGKKNLKFHFNLDRWITDQRSTVFHPKKKGPTVRIMTVGHVAAPGLLDLNIFQIQRSRLINNIKIILKKLKIQKIKITKKIKKYRNFFL